ncbi:MAG: S-layer homology domain-containing protein, partial [Clostridia bacterium]|nr:S-layer homology domain-containing protein [Clostridia bacterium]
MKKILSIILAVVFIVGALCVFSYAEDGKMPFRDVKEKNWYYSAVDAVWRAGIMGGVSDTEFSPNGALSRAMFVTILGRLAGAPETGYTPDTFPDTKKNTWYSPYV